MPELSAAPSINDSRTQALLKLIARLADLDLAPMLVYRIDSVPLAALPFLAWQFDILSPLWQLIAPVAIGVDALTNVDLLIDIDNLIETGGLVSVGSLTEAAQREMLKSAVPLHRFRGTPRAVKQALAALGWTQVSLLEGQSRWGGAAYPASQGWAVLPSDDRSDRRPGGAERSGIDGGRGSEIFQAGTRVVGLDMVCDAFGVRPGTEAGGQIHAHRNSQISNRCGSSTYGHCTGYSYCLCGERRCIRSECTNLR
jgi:tail protein P2 I